MQKNRLDVILDEDLLLLLLMQLLLLLVLLRVDGEGLRLVLQLFAIATCRGVKKLRLGLGQRQRR